MRKQLISFAQVIKFLLNIKLRGVFNPNPNPLAYALEHHSRKTSPDKKSLHFLNQ